MNKLVKRIAAITVFAMLVGILTPVTAVQAVEKQTMYVGEKFEYTLIGGTLTSVTSSKKTVVKTAKVKGRDAYTFEAKKAGSATITIKYKDWRSKSHSKKLKVTVKKLDIKASVQSLDSGYVLLALKNNTKQTFDSVYVRYTLKDSSGEVVKEDTERVSYVMSGKTAYDTVYAGRDLDIDYSKSVVKLVLSVRDPQNTYTNVSKKNLVVTKQDETDNGSSISFKLKLQNKLNKNVQVVHYLISYDAQGNIIDLEKWTNYMNKKETRTTSEYSVSKSSYSHPTFDHYEVVTQAYTSERKK